MRVLRIKEMLHLILDYSCIIILSLIPLSDNFELSSPLFVIGNVDQDVILPCHVKFKTQAKLMQIQWNKRVNRTIENVYQFTALVDEGIYGQDYKARAVVSKEGLNTGDVSLKLKKVQMLDEGSYSCMVQSSEDWVDQVQIVLHVENLGGNSSTSSRMIWALPLICILTFLLLVLIAGFVFYCKRKEKQMKAQMRNSENNPNLLEKQPQENRVLLSPFKIQDTQNQLENLKDEHAKLQTKYKKLEQQHENLNREHANLKEEHEILKEEHEKLKQELQGKEGKKGNKLRRSK